jgi:hypothetical protein
VLSKVRTWAGYSYAASFRQDSALFSDEILTFILVRKSKIDSGLAKCTAQIDNVMKTFDVILFLQ